MRPRVGRGAAWGLFWLQGPSAGLARCWVSGPHTDETLFHLTVPFGVWLPGLPTPCPFPLVFWTFLGLKSWGQRLDFICRQWGAPGVTEVAAILKSVLRLLGGEGGKGQQGAPAAIRAEYLVGNYSKGLQPATHHSGHQRQGGE